MKKHLGSDNTQLRAHMCPYIFFKEEINYGSS